MEYDNTGRGVLFKNENKTEDYHGDYTGSINVAGVDHFLDAYLKTSKAGKKFFSLKIGKAKNAPTGHKPAREPGSDDDKGYTKRAEAFDDDENLPF